MSVYVIRAFIRLREVLVENQVMARSPSHQSGSTAKSLTEVFKAAKSQNETGFAQPHPTIAKRLNPILISFPCNLHLSSLSFALMRILLVEDEEKVARFIERGLKAELYTVDIATDGKSSLSCLSRNSYDLVILDLNLPDMPGQDVLTYIRNSKRLIPVLVLTARDSLADKIDNFQRGADDYLTKPFSFTELVLRVKALLRRGQSFPTDVLQVADLTLDRSAHEVRRNGKLVELTSKEFALLEYFMANVGRVLSRTMIVENVWDQSFEGLTNIVDVYVLQLRRKIDDQTERKLIRTVRGVGYSVTEQGA
jgi:DNA-binding response OmpR family regulator